MAIMVIEVVLSLRLNVIVAVELIAVELIVKLNKAKHFNCEDALRT
jgi:hypothetical protein